MKIAFFPGFTILLCILTITSTVSEIFHMSNGKDVHVSKHLVNAPERNNESAVADISHNTNKFELATKSFTTNVEKNQRGKGSNGGGVVRQPRNSAATLKQPSIYMLTTYVISSLLLLLVLPFVIP